MIFDPEFLAVILSVFVLTRLNKSIDLSHRILKGVRYWYAPANETLKLLLPPGHKRGSKKQREDLRSEEKVQTKHMVNLLVNHHSAIIKETELVKLSFYEEYELLLLVSNCAIVSFVATELVSLIRGTVPTEVGYFVLLFMVAIVFGILTKWILTYKTWSGIETTLCLWSGILTSTLSLVTLNLPEGFTEFNSRQAYLDIKSNIKTLYQSIDNTTSSVASAATAAATAASSELSVSQLAESNSYLYYTLILAGFCFIVGFIFFLPCFRFAYTYLTVINHKEFTTSTRVLFHTSYIVELLSVLSFYRPLVGDMIVNKDNNNSNNNLSMIMMMNKNTFESIRLLLVLVSCLLRLVILRPNIQAHLLQASSKDVVQEIADKLLAKTKNPLSSSSSSNSSSSNVLKKGKKRANHNNNIEDSFLPAQCYLFLKLCIVVVHYIAPILCTLCFALMWNRKGDVSTGFHFILRKVFGSYIPASNVDGGAIGDADGNGMESEVGAAMYSVLSTVFVDVKDVTIFSPLYSKSIFSFLTWFTMASHLLIMTIGLLYYRNHVFSSSDSISQPI